MFVDTLKTVRWRGIECDKTNGKSHSMIWTLN